MNVEKPARSSLLAGSGGRTRDKRPAPSERRELVALEPAEPRGKPQSRLADALFLAHLFATRFQAPQTREKRRAEPGEASASYRGAAQHAAPAGRTLSRKI